MQPEPEKSTKTIVQINNQGGLAFGNAWRTEWKLFRIVFGYAKGTTCLSHWFDQRFTQGMQLYDRYNTTMVSMPILWEINIVKILAPKESDLDMIL